MSQKAKQKFHCLLDSLIAIDNRNLDGLVEVNYEARQASGGFACTFIGVYKQSQQYVCVKVLHQVDVMDDVKFRIFSRRLETELKIWQDLRHPNIVDLHGWTIGLGMADRLTASFISTWCEGGDVKKYLRNHPLADRGRIICSVAEGIAYLHLRGIVHGDITPRNVVIDHEGSAKLCDFGVSSILGDRSTYAEGSSAIRSPRFMAPELFNADDNEVHRDERSDVWAFGCTSAEILSNQPPYHELRDVHVMFAIVRKTPPYTWDPPDEVGRVIAQCMEFQPNLRPGMLEVTTSFRHLGLVIGDSTLAQPTREVASPPGGSYSALPPETSSTKADARDTRHSNYEPDILGHIPHDAYTICTLEKFCMDLQRSSLARKAQIVSLKRYGKISGVPHRFLILDVEQLHGHGGEFYIRLDRRHDKRIPFWKFVLKGGVSDAKDFVSFVVA
ncbi:kinase-like domain-containing protein [Cantharellus anzutake]|uniref:kinase-like domain-containing protein n=1 Tax=Cantharellus anzutake TaxID=1750568 RepID=UPI00190836C4|nr:kinase-like domain-containing protein [Cantharellus anzutake]KAF8312182.1 kinase-like domain-containing protein [Cantharellus anzutake]